ncbi:MAG: MarR family transcriptional regulator [Kiritimatiellae bacterium]|nr:MarR family transcriptional regulator [Kiritimatiellia bacterium]
MPSNCRNHRPAPPRAAATLDRSMLPLWRRIYQEFAARGQRWGLPINVGMTLVHLYLHPDEAEPAHLASANCFPRQTITFVLDALERQKLARREPHPSDRRRKQVVLTAAGRKLGARLFADLLGFEAQALSAIPAGSLDTFRNLVKCYADALARHNAGALPA